jgi:prephenate dehydrogenase
MTARFGTVAIIGVGLLGASLGLALKSRGLAAAVRGAGRRQESLDQALATNAIDTAHLDAREACDGADLVVLCTPAALVALKMDEIQSACNEETIVTDVASTKGLIAAHAAHTWPKPLRFVGSHPMAGSEKYGPEFGRADLYEGAWTIVCPRDADPAATKTVHSLWEAVGSRVIETTPEEHDAVVAVTSHIPHIVSASIAELAGEAGDVAPFIGNGFRDVTRIAGGRPEIWRDICLTNPDAITEGLARLIDELAVVRKLIQDRDGEGLSDFFAAAREARTRIVPE